MQVWRRGAPLDAPPGAPPGAPSGAPSPSLPIIVIKRFASGSASQCSIIDVLVRPNGSKHAI